METKQWEAKAPLEKSYSMLGICILVLDNNSNFFVQNYANDGFVKSSVEDTDNCLDNSRATGNHTCVVTGLWEKYN